MRQVGRIVLVFGLAPKSCTISPHQDYPHGQGSGSLFYSKPGTEQLCVNKPSNPHFSSTNGTKPWPSSVPQIFQERKEIKPGKTSELTLYASVLLSCCVLPDFQPKQVRQPGISSCDNSVTFTFSWVITKATKWEHRIGRLSTPI